MKGLWFASVPAAAISLASQAFACSGMTSPSGHAVIADVIVEGYVKGTGRSDSSEVFVTNVIKGQKADRYEVKWVVMGGGDECAFLDPEWRKRGVYFLKRASDGEYFVSWTEERWEQRWERE